MHFKLSNIQQPSAPEIIPPSLTVKWFAELSLGLFCFCASALRGNESLLHFHPAGLVEEDSVFGPPVLTLLKRASARVKTEEEDEEGVRGKAGEDDEKEGSAKHRGRMAERQFC